MWRHPLHLLVSRLDNVMEFPAPMATSPAKLESILSRLCPDYPPPPVRPHRIGNERRCGFRMSVNPPQETPRFDSTWLHPRTWGRSTPHSLPVDRLPKTGRPYGNTGAGRSVPSGTGILGLESWPGATLALHPLWRPVYTIP